MLHRIPMLQVESPLLPEPPLLPMHFMIRVLMRHAVLEIADSKRGPIPPSLLGLSIVIGAVQGPAVVEGSVP